MPCVSIKDAEWITSSLQEDPKNNSLPTLQLQVHGEMLSELVFKQFVIGDKDSRPTSSLTEFKTLNDEKCDEARMLSQELSQDESEPVSDARSNML